MQSDPDILQGIPSHLPPPAPPPAARPQRWGLHVGLFVATFISAMWFQSIDWSGATSLSEALLAPWRNPTQLRDGFIFALTLLAILLAHEMGHYLTARRHGVDQSLPFFIPAPTLFGTLGAVILMRSQPANRRVLLRVAVAGPFAGLVLAIPACIWGLAHSVPSAGLPSAAEPVIGPSILWSVLVHYFAPPAEVAVNLHPVAFAGWAGLLVTALNLIPAAQLDGGHIAYALFGARQVTLSRAIVVMLLVMGIFLGANGSGAVWLVWAVLLALVGLRHPPVRDEYERLGRGERVAGWLAMALFLLTFVPIPLIREPMLQGSTPGLEQPAQPGEHERGPDDTAPAPKDGEAEEIRL